MLVPAILEEVLKLKKVIGGRGGVMVFYHDLQDSLWGGGGAEKMYLEHQGRLPKHERENFKSHHSPTSA